VKLLGVPEQKGRRRYGIGIGAEIGDVRDPLLFVHDQILDDVQILGTRLECQMRRCVAVGAAVVHVDMDVATPPPRAGRLSRRSRTMRRVIRTPRWHIHVGTKI